tara:strand:- start:6 stop:398 length:393 start_codon:yes stop_codon:yes gene_type:complete
MENNYVTKEDFNKFKEQLKPIIMNVLDRLTTIESKIDKVYDLTQELANSSINTGTEQKSEQKTEVITSDLVKYSRDNVKELFSSTDDDFTKKFCQSILSKDYDTLTQKQFKKVMELANKANYYKPIKKDE